MNIIFVYDFAFINGGAARIAISEAIALSQAGHNITFFSGVGPVDLRLQAAGVNVICMNQTELKEQLDGFKSKISGAFQGIWNNSALKEFKKLLNQYSSNDTVVFFHGWSLALSPALFLETARYGFQIAIMCHDYELLCPNRTFFNFRRQEACDCRPMSLRCVCTNCDKRSYAQKLYRIVRQMIMRHLLKKNKVALVYYSKNAERLLRKYFPIKYIGHFVSYIVDVSPLVPMVPSKNHRYVFVGRLSPEKGVELFCEAVTQAGVEADVIGTGESIEEVKRRYPNVNFLGWLTSDEMAVHIRNARCLIVTSLWNETGPLNILETQISYRLPCILPSGCGVSDIVKSFHSGFLYEMGDYESLCRAIECSKNDDEIANMSDNCQKIPFAKYMEASHVTQLVEIFHSIIG